MLKQKLTESNHNADLAINYSKSLQDDKYIRFFSTSGLTSGLTRMALRGGAALMGAELASALLRMGSMIILARLLLPEDFGLLAMVTAITVFAERFKDIGLSDATVQSKDINHDQVSNLFWINFAICLGLALLLAFLSKTIAWFYNEPRLVAISIVIASTFVFSGLVIQHQALLRRQLHFGSLAFIQISSIILSLFVALFLAYYGFGYWSLVAREFSRAVFVVIGTWLACPWQPRLPKRGVTLAHLLSFAKYITSFNLLVFFSQSVDKILIGRLFGPVNLGLYTNAHQLIRMPTSQIQYPVNTVALPALSALQTDPCKFRAYHENMLQLLSFLCMPVIVFLALFADIITDLLLGPKWIKLIPIFQILAIGSFIEPVVATVGPAMVAYGRVKEYFQVGLASTLLLLLCIGTGCLAGDTIGVAIGFSISSYLTLIVCLIYGLRHTPIRSFQFLLIIVPALVCSLCTGLVLLGFRNCIGWVTSPISLFLFAPTGTIIYIGFWIILIFF